MPQSRRRYGRSAMRARYRKPKRRRGGSLGWNVAIAVVVLVGVGLIAFTVNGNNSSGAGTAPPQPADPASGRPQDHWHTYLGADICGQWLTPVPAFENSAQNASVQAGIHSHGDGLIHTHPFTTAEAGKNATLGKYAGYGGWSVSSDSIDAWVGPKGDQGDTSWSNGDTCAFGKFKGQKGNLVWAVDGKPKTGNPSDYHQQDGETIAIGFLPKEAKLGFPPGACNAFANISDQQTAAVVSQDSPCRSAATTTTSPPTVSTDPPTTTLAP